MSTARIFVCYAENDLSFAMQLIADLRNAGAEVLTDSMGLDDPDFEHFLNEVLPQSQHLIVVQTPDVLQSTRVRSIVYAALKHVQEGQMTVVSRMIAPTNSAATEMPIPRMWAPLPEFDARQDYPRTLVRLCWLLGLTEQNATPVAPPPPLPPMSKPGTPQPVAVLPPVLSLPMQSYSEQTVANPRLDSLTPAVSSQWPTEKDRPLQPYKYTRSPLDPRLLLISLILVVLLVVAGVIVFVHQGTASSLAKATPLPTINALSMTPAQLYSAVTSRPTAYASPLSKQDKANWDQSAACSFTDGGYEVQASAPGFFSICSEHAFTYKDFAFQVQMTIQSGANSDGGGLVFREASAGAYRLRVGLNGSFDLTGTDLNSSSPVVKTGSGQSNLLTVIVQGPEIFLYINTQNIATVSSTTFKSGSIGFMAVAFSQATTVTFANIKVWTF